jgi:hypothetical protein
MPAYLRHAISWAGTRKIDEAGLLKFKPSSEMIGIGSVSKAPEEISSYLFGGENFLIPFDKSENEKAEERYINRFRGT